VPGFERPKISSVCGKAIHSRLNRSTGEFTMKLDLQKDAQKIRRHIENRIRNYPVYENLGPGDDTHDVVLVTFGYYIEQTGYFAMVIDTRPEADSDGEWTLHIENDVNVIAFPKWCAAFEKLCDGGSVDVTMPDGTIRKLDESEDNESVAKLFGEMILEVVRALRDAGAFENLPLGPKAFLSIEEFDGNWGWPAYSKRKSLGRLRRDK
jgi:hypothetical protein